MKKPEATLYKRGINEIIDKYLDPDETLWIIQGVHGRRPVLAKTKEEALAKYEQ